MNIFNRYANSNYVTRHAPLYHMSIHKMQQELTEFLFWVNKQTNDFEIGLSFDLLYQLYLNDCPGKKTKNFEKYLTKSIVFTPDKHYNLDHFTVAAVRKKVTKEICGNKNKRYSAPEISELFVKEWALEDIKKRHQSINTDSLIGTYYIHADDSLLAEIDSGLMPDAELYNSNTNQEINSFDNSGSFSLSLDKTVKSSAINKASPVKHKRPAIKQKRGDKRNELKKLNIFGCEVSDEDVLKLKKMNEFCKIIKKLRMSTS